MTPEQLKRFRQLLFLSQSEAADHIGQCSHRSWNYWESGQRTIPDDVKQSITNLLRERAAYVEALEFGDSLTDVDDLDFLEGSAALAALAHVEASKIV